MKRGSGPIASAYLFSAFDFLPKRKGRICGLANALCEFEDFGHIEIAVVSCGFEVWFSVTRVIKAARWTRYGVRNLRACPETSPLDVEVIPHIERLPRVIGTNCHVTVTTFESTIGELNVYRGALRALFVPDGA